MHFWLRCSNIVQLTIFAKLAFLSEIKIHIDLFDIYFWENANEGTRHRASGFPDQFHR